MGHTAKKIIYLAFAVFVISFCIFFAYPYVKKFQAKTETEQILAGGIVNSDDGAIETLNIGDSLLRVTIANSDQSREKGLGQRGSLADDEGMLFVFDKPGNYAFWMKDMIFPIDIAWVNADLSIVYIENNVAPSTYPNSFSSSKPASFVIETNAGYFASHHLSVGDSVSVIHQ